MVAAAADPSSRMPLRYIAAAELIRLDGDRAPDEAFEFLGSTRQDEVKRAPGSWCPYHQYGSHSALRNALENFLAKNEFDPYSLFEHRKGALDHRIPFGVGLLESSYGELDVARTAVGKPGRLLQLYLPLIGPARNRGVEVSRQDPDWLGAIISAGQLWIYTYPTRGTRPVERIKTNLFTLFGLPEDRTG